MKRSILLQILAVLLVLSSLMVCGCGANSAATADHVIQAESEKPAFSTGAEAGGNDDQLIRAEMERPDFGKGAKAALYNSSTQAYSFDSGYVPEEYRTTDPAEIGVIVTYQVIGSSVYSVRFTSVSEYLDFDVEYPFDHPISENMLDGSVMVKDTVYAFPLELAFTRHLGTLAEKKAFAEQFTDTAALGGGSGMIARDAESGSYSFDLIPPWLLADSPANVGYIVTFSQEYVPFSGKYTNDPYTNTSGNSISDRTVSGTYQIIHYTIQDALTGEELVSDQCGSEPYRVNISEDTPGKTSQDYLQEVSDSEVWNSVSATFLQYVQYASVLPSYGSTLSTDLRHLDERLGNGAVSVSGGDLTPYTEITDPADKQQLFDLFIHAPFASLTEAFLGENAYSWNGDWSTGLDDGLLAEIQAAEDFAERTIVITFALNDGKTLTAAYNPDHQVFRNGLAYYRLSDGDAQIAGKILGF